MSNTEYRRQKENRKVLELHHLIVLQSNVFANPDFVGGEGRGFRG